MKKRLRRKFRTGEFTEYEFQVQFRMAPPAGEAAAYAMLETFLDQLEGQSLSGGGSWSNEGEFAFFVFAKREHGAVTEAHRLGLETWLTANPAVTTATVGPLLDVMRVL